MGIFIVDVTNISLKITSFTLLVLSNVEEIQGAAKKSVYGILGIITLLKGELLILICNQFQIFY